MSEQPPTVYQYSVKLETTQKAVNVTVHVYSNDYKTTWMEAIDLLKTTRINLEKEGFVVAPLEVKEK